MAHLSYSRPHPYQCRYLGRVRWAPMARSASFFFSTLMPMLVGWRYGRVGARGFRFEFRPVVTEHSIRLVCGS